VVHVIFRLDFGGLENGLVNLINNMPQQRFRHAIVCLSGFSEFRDRIRRSDVAVYSIDKKPGKDWKAYLRMWRLLKRLRPTIVHTRNLGTVDFQWIALSAGVRHRVHGEHGWEASDPTGSNPKNLLIRKVCSRAIQRYISVSQNIAEWLATKVGIARNRITQIYNGVDAERFAPAGPYPSDLPWAQTEHPFVFGTVGRLDPIKNQLGLIDAFAALVKRNPAGADNLRLVIAGAGPLADALRSRVEQHALQRQVWLPGARNDAAALIRSFDVFVLPSFNEGISNTILEAMATGKPVIAGSVGGNTELIEHNVSGQLIDLNRPGALEDAMAAYCGNSARAAAHGAAARARALARYSLDAMVQSYMNVYDQLTAGQRSNAESRA
jgi:sugar transferase (PEP-CTERM/EpsH1 system associated)